MTSSTASGSSTVANSALTFELADDGTFPNNAELPALLYRDVVSSTEGKDPAAAIEALFERHGWSNGWRNGVYDFHHYHSTAHEVLGCYSGTARVQLGGPNGPEVDFGCGDVLVIPAGVAHKKIRASSDFRVVGCYAEGLDYDMNYGKPGERPRADTNIARLSRPQCDPVQGKSGVLIERWNHGA